MGGCSPTPVGLANGLTLLYPVGEAAHHFATAGTDPFLIGSFAAPAATAAWVSTYKTHGSKRYSGVVAATAAGIPIWLATAARIGIFNMGTLATYTAAATLTWSGYTWSDVLQQRRAWKGEQARWSTLATTASLEDSRLVSAEDTRLGQRFRIDIRGTGKTARQHARGDLAERIAAVLGLPAERVRVSTDTKHAGIIVIAVQTLDPWAEDCTHPALDGTLTTATGRSVLDGPFVLGTDPDTGHNLDITIFDKSGGRTR